MLPSVLSDPTLHLEPTPETNQLDSLNTNFTVPAFDVDKYFAKRSSHLDNLCPHILGRILLSSN